MTHDSSDFLRLCAGSVPLRSPKPRHALIAVEGPDAPDFLHRLSSQEILALEPGRAARAAFLDPKGKLVAIAIVVREGDRVLVETPLETAEALHGLLDRYHFTEKLAIRKLSGFDGAEWSAAEILGSGAGAVLGLQPGSAEVGEGEVAISAVRNGVEALRVYGGLVEDPRIGAVDTSDPLRVERLRILSGLPSVGIDSEPTTLALEADLDDHVSTTKGCYTGQEIVARIHTYGHVNRKLVRMWFEGFGDVAKDTPLCTVEEGAPLGRITSAVDLPDDAGRLALGYLPGPFLEDPEPIAVGGEGGPKVELLSD